MAKTKKKPKKIIQYYAVSREIGEDIITEYGTPDWLDAFAHKCEVMGRHGRLGVTIDYYDGKYWHYDIHQKMDTENNRTRSLSA
jgi:hypothetical protein